MRCSLDLPWQRLRRTRALAWLLPCAGWLAVVPTGGAQGAPRGAGASDYLYVWATAIDTVADSAGRPRRRGVFLATVDLRRDSPTRGRVIGAVLAADTAGRGAHHTEHALAPDRLLFANDFGAGRTHRFDLRAPGAPRLLGGFTTAGPFGFPHSFVRLPNGHILATFQWQGSNSRRAGWPSCGATGRRCGGRGPRRRGWTPSRSSPTASRWSRRSTGRSRPARA